MDADFVNHEQIDLTKYKAQIVQKEVLKMRGSVYYQTSVLAKLVFESGTKKVVRKDKSSDKYQIVASFNTMNTYRKTWNDLGFYIFEVFEIRDFEKLEPLHVEKFMYEKIFLVVSHQYLQRVSSAIGKLELSLNKFAKQQNRDKTYDFSIRKGIVKEAKNLELTVDNYRDRAYDYPTYVIDLLDDDKFMLAANIQLTGGARSEGVCLIKKKQLNGIKIDKITNQKMGVIITAEKGGKVGAINMSSEAYTHLAKIIEQEGVFKIDYRRYVEAIQNACRILNIKCEGSHGFRWNFVQRRILEYHEAGYTYKESLQFVSCETKHMRPDITTYYTG